MGVLSFDKPYADRLFASVKDERFKPFAFRYDAVDQIEAIQLQQQTRFGIGRNITRKKKA